MPPSAIETNKIVILNEEVKWCFQTLAQKLSNYLAIYTFFSEHNKCGRRMLLSPTPGTWKQLVWAFFQIAELSLSTQGKKVECIFKI